MTTDAPPVTTEPQTPTTTKESPVTTTEPLPPTTTEPVPHQFFECGGVTENGHPWSYHGPDPAVCSTVVPATPPMDNLPETGVDGVLVAWALVLVAVGGALLLAAKGLGGRRERA